MTLSKPTPPVLNTVYEQPATLAKVANNCVFNLIQVLLTKKVIGKEDLAGIFTLNHDVVQDSANLHMISAMLNNLRQLSEHGQAIAEWKAWEEKATAL